MRTVSLAFAAALAVSPAFAAKMAKPISPAAHAVGVHTAQPALAHPAPALGAPSGSAATPATSISPNHNCVVGQSPVPKCS